MKKSEYRRQRFFFWQNAFRNGSDPGANIDELVDRDQRAAEVAGVVWDPEEEPLPGKLTCNAICDGRGVLRPHLFPAKSTPWEWIQEEHKGEETAIYAEAVRRYNAWPELDNVCYSMERRDAMRSDWTPSIKALRTILRGGSR